MSKSRFLVTVATLAFLISAASGLSAQEGQKGLSFGPSARPFTQPGSLVTDDFFDYDAQLWAPYDVTSLDGHQPANTGFYFVFDLSYLSIGKPDAVPGADPRQFSTGSRWHWGRNYRTGYMSEAGSGFDVDWLNLTGLTYTFGQDTLVTQPQQLDLSYNTLQLNKTFRQELSHGGYVEPYFGLRYTNITDNTIEDGVAGVPVTTDRRFRQEVTNSAIGGQVGARMFRRRGRVTFEGDAAIGAAYNAQRYFSFDYIFTRANGTFVVNEITNEADAFLPTLDLALRMSVNLTRDISFRFGGELQWMWSGVARADIRQAALNPNSAFGPGTFPTAVNSEDFIAAGFSWGFDWRR